MDFSYVLMVAARWIHILAAALALGVPMYMRYVLLPALQGLDETSRGRLREELARRWRLCVHLLIVLFLATGLYTFLGVARWRALPAEEKFQYHLLFGIKFIIALAMFFISSALAGRAAGLAAMRANAALWLNILIVLGLVLVAISNVLRFM
jgi:uncharacterized membrane protein